MLRNIDDRMTLEKNQSVPRKIFFVVVTEKNTKTDCVRGWGCIFYYNVTPT